MRKVALALCVNAGAVAPAATGSADDVVSGVDADGAPDERSSASTPRPAATVEESSDWREILPGLTLGSQLRLRTESRRNTRFDAARPGNDEDYLLSRFRFDLTWEPSDWVTGIVELQDARIHGEEAIEVGYGAILRRRLPAGRQFRAGHGGLLLLADDGRVLRGAAWHGKHTHKIMI